MIFHLILLLTRPTQTISTKLNGTLVVECSAIISRFVLTTPVGDDVVTWDEGVNRRYESIVSGLEFIDNLVNFFVRQFGSTFGHSLCLVPQIYQSLVLLCIVLTRTATDAIVLECFFECFALGDYFAHSSFKCFTSLQFNSRTKNPCVLVVVCANRNIVTAQQELVLWVLVLGVNGICRSNDQFAWSSSIRNVGGLLKIELLVVCFCAPDVSIDTLMLHGVFAFFLVVVGFFWIFYVHFHNYHFPSAFHLFGVERWRTWKSYVFSGLRFDVVNFKVFYFFVCLLEGENTLVVEASGAGDEFITEQIGCTSCFGRSCALEYILFAGFDVICCYRIFADTYRPVVCCCVDGTHWSEHACSHHCLVDVFHDRVFE